MLLLLLLGELLAVVLASALWEESRRTVAVSHVMTTSALNGVTDIPELESRIKFSARSCSMRPMRSDNREILGRLH